MHDDHRSRKSVFALTGWLFADMFLAIMMIFIAASTVGKYDPPVKQGVTPTPQISGIDRHAQSISIFVNVSLLIHNDPATLKSVRDQVTNKLHANRTRKAGIVLTFSCGLDDWQDTNVSNHLNATLHELGIQHFIFDKAAFSSFIDRGCTSGVVNLEIYYFIFSAH